MPTDTTATPDLGSPGMVLRFPDGLPGFPGEHAFQLVALDDEGLFQELRSIGDPNLAFIVTSPWHFYPDYVLDIGESDRRELELERPDEAVALSTVTVGEGDPPELYLNLLAPIVVNVRTHTGRQVILDDEELPLRAPALLDGAS